MGGGGINFGGDCENIIDAITRHYMLNCYMPDSLVISSFPGKYMAHILLLLSGTT